MVQQYSEVYSLLDPELFDTIDSVGSALSLHGVRLKPFPGILRSSSRTARNIHATCCSPPCRPIRRVARMSGLEIYRRLYTELAQP
ncbi:hypothetical protein HBI38_130700 [Parastagonospora nodorum]|nr:hypothetical protein HBH46_159300 [Parastagonospora nodorum]KAH4186751.1 hypothetical protein HBI95_238470 [Parastagonospora nodorum]KAH4963698.1 hypothetical protein HBI78_117910 [Parastagonospora nodorum]KAH5055544.1 hypothetical protein HBH96_126660 [Parastagonospora nodorum]KAH5780150.1 hypothetical protein HBI16_051560 [Parastagonospora nodorum]